ncbi:ribosomal biogenesis factor-like [Daphnia carinata]|uniref:ribosomal biogenesis factor-like n=1 Tax=Daphnia carinata TaxID=120202 RepID=UPI002581007C|nr:ribosomal biogenesis factor-like [Daphnia carinata]
MGKNKGGKSKQNPVFRVAGGKAAKAKAKFKAQPVNTNLKKLNANMREKIENLDSSLGKVRENLTALPKKKEIIVNEAVPLPPADINKAIDSIASL